MDSKNDTQSERIPQGISRNFKVVDNKDTKAETLPKQYGKMPFGITPHLTKLSAKALLLYVDLSQLFWGESNSLSLTTNPITDDGLAKRTGFSLTKTAHARRELVDSGVVEIIKTAHADSGKLKRVFRLSQVEEMGKDKRQPEASNSSNRTEACVQNEQHHVFKMDNTMCSKRTNQNQEKKSAKPDGDSVSAIDSQEPLLVLPTSNIPTTTTKANEWIEQQTYWSQKMGGTLAELHDHIKQEFKLSDDYAYRVMDALGNDKGGINYPQGYMNHRDGIEHLAKIAQDILQQIKNEQNQIEQEREKAKREEAKQQRKLQLEQRQTVFQGLGSQFDKDIQNTLKGVSMDSRVYYDALGKEKLLEGKIDTFLRNSEDIIKPIYDKHVETSLDTDDVIEREEALKKRLGVMWDWDQEGTRLGDFSDLIKQKILSDVQLQSPFTLDDDSKPQRLDTPILRQMAKQPTKPSASDKAKAKPQAGLPPMAGGGFDEGLKQELIKQGLIELEADTLGTWANSMNTSKMLANAGMTSKELVKEVLSRAGDKSEPTSVTGGANEPVSQDGEQDTLRQNCLSVSQNQAPKLGFDISQAGG